MDKNNKIVEVLTDKAFSRLIITSILGIFVCIVCLCSATFAWFTTNTTSGSNVLDSGRFALEISVVDENGESVSVVDNGNGTFTCVLESVGNYTVALKMTDDTTATKGYCDVTINTVNVKQTHPISKNADIGVDPFSFTIEANEENTVVVFKPKWGLSANADIENGGVVVDGELEVTTEEVTEDVVEDATEEEFVESTDETIETLPAESTDEAVEEELSEDTELQTEPEAEIE